MAGIGVILLIHPNLVRIVDMAANEARIGQGLGSTKWKGLNLFIIYFTSLT
jgi:hypothetical protein